MLRIQPIYLPNDTRWHVFYTVSSLNNRVYSTSRYKKTGLTSLP
jgi:hypothetical protein